MNGNAVLEHVRRYRVIASLYRQTAAFRPLQRASLLGEAERWEHRAIAEIETYFTACGGLNRAREFPVASRSGAAWDAMAVAA